MSTKTMGVISDTHGLLRPEAVRALSGCEAIIHAGDVGDSSILSRLKQIAPLHAVRGNCDSASLGLQRTLVVELDPWLVYVLHDLGRLDLDPEAAGVSVVVSGHSHEPVIRRQGRVLYLNPGSAGPRRFSLPITVALLRLEEQGPRAEIVDLAC